jgi:hypothetical protein
MRTLSSIITAIVVCSAAALGSPSVSAGSWWGSDHDDYYYDRPWYGGPWYGRYPGYGWGYPGYGWGGYGWGYPGYGWGGYPGNYGGPQVIRIYTEEPRAPRQDETIR